VIYSHYDITSKRHVVEARDNGVLVAKVEGRSLYVALTALRKALSKRGKFPKVTDHG